MFSIPQTEGGVEATAPTDESADRLLLQQLCLEHFIQG